MASKGHRFQQRMQSAVDQAARAIGDASDEAVGGFAHDVSQMSAAILRDEVGPNATGITAANISANGSNMNYELRVNPPGGIAGYVEFNTHTRSGATRQGKRFIIRAVFGMLGRWRNGGRWTP
ncbi:MAG: hypothetical protein GY851_24895 [bacterium]|nr:hypothetical protein [bacterium]